jgi:GNAT superfamily N-acetyltransferase
MTNFKDFFIRPFESNDVDALVDVLVEMNSIDANYPPHQDTDGSRASMESWLLDEMDAHRWIIELDGVTVGHILLAPAHPYLSNHLGKQIIDSKRLLEVGKFFVSPQYREHGLGHRLFDFMQESVPEGTLIALAVIETSVEAVRFYQKKGLTPYGSFVGVHGVNHVFAVPEIHQS